MNKLLIAVKSCCRYWMAGYHDAILDTWGKDVPANVDLRLFVGDDPSCLVATLLKEVRLNAPDDYMSLPWKTKDICTWSFIRGYDYVFFCDTDTFLIPKLLFQSGFEKYDYSGQFGAVHPVGQTFHYSDAYGDYLVCYPWASGGVGYFLSQKACQIVSISEPSVWAEDMFVGQCLGPHISLGYIEAANLPIEGDSAWHFPRRKFKQPYDLKFNWMQDMYKRYN